MPVQLSRVPLGVLLIAALFAILSAGSLLGGLYLLFLDGSIGAWAAVMALLAAPLSLYFAMRLTSLAPWTWMALVVLIWFLFLSSVLRFVATPGLVIAQLGEIVLEVSAAYYLLRPSVRAAFGR
jgi:hypothetical protein